MNNEQSTPYLIFTVARSLYGVAAPIVEEIFLLPEVTPVVEAAPDLVGVVNLRRDILPVIDLAQRLGYQSQDYALTDSMIVLSWQDYRLGIIVNQVREVQFIPMAEVVLNWHSGGEIPRQDRFLTGIAKLSDEMVMLLNHQRLIQGTTEISSALQSDPVDDSKKQPTDASTADFYLKDRSVFCPNATPQERELFRQRASNLRQTTADRTFTGLISVAVVGLNGEYFGLELGLVREFTNIRTVTPIPCCPAHIVGNINLRGEIVTLIDIRGVLNLSLADRKTIGKAMVIALDDLIAGVIVDEVFDVVYLDPEEIAPVPTTVCAISNEYLQGTAPYLNKMMGLLDISKILSRGELVVDEEVA